MSQRRIRSGILAVKIFMITGIILVCNMMGHGFLLLVVFY